MKINIHLSIKQRLTLGHSAVVLFVLLIGIGSLLLQNKMAKQEQLVGVSHQVERHILSTNYYLREFIEFGDKESSQQLFIHLDQIKQSMDSIQHITNISDTSIIYFCEKYKSVAKSYIASHEQTLLAQKGWVKSGTEIGDKFTLPVFASAFGRESLIMIKNHTQVQLAGLDFNANPTTITGDVDSARVDKVKSKAEECKNYIIEVQGKLGSASHQVMLKKTVDKYNDYLSYLEMIKMLLGFDKMAVDKMDAYGDQMLTKSESIRQQIKQEQERLVKTSRTATAIALIAIIAFALTINHRISKNVFDGVAQGVAFAEKLSEGKLYYKLDLERHDEIGRLVSALNTMNEKLTEIVTQIVDMSSDLNSSSGEIMTNANSLSKLATEFSSSIEEISSTVDEITTNVQQNNENAHGIKQLSDEIMNAIDDAFQSSKGVVNASNNIHREVETISKIASQTHLLAINASIEAAHAGQYGKGFTVVANEVRKLSAMTQEAALRISEIAAQSHDTSRSANSELEQVLPNISKSNRLINEMFINSEQLRAGIEQVNTAINQFSSGIQTSVATSESLASYSNKMNQKAMEHEQLVEFFSVEDDSDTKK